MALVRGTLRRLALALFAVSFLVARGGAAAPFDSAGHDWEGYSDFAELARAKLGSSFVATQRLDFGALRADDTVFVVHPERSLDVSSFASFMAAGGRVVLLDDFGTGDALLRRFDIRRLPLPMAPSAELRKNANLAIAEPVGTDPLVRDVARVVTNHATGLGHPSLSPLLEVRGQDGASVVLALVGRTGRGRLVVVGDSSVFMNAMLRYPGNAALARNMAAFASRPSGKAYLVRGAFEQTGRFVDVSGADATPGGHATSLGELLGLGPRSSLVLAGLVGLGVVVWVGSTAGRTYRASVPRMTRIVPLFTQGGAAGRAAAIGARRVPREAAMIEIGKALEERLCLALGKPNAPQHEALVAEVVANGLIASTSAVSLRALLSQVSHIDTLVRAGREGATRRPTDADVLAAAEISARIQAEIEARRRAGRAA